MSEKPYEKQPRYKLRKGSLAGLIIGLVIAATCALIARQDSLSGWQLVVFRAVNNLPDGLQTTAQVVSDGLAVPLGIILLIVIFLLFKRWRVAWRIFVTAGGAGLVAEIVKHVVKEPRPAHLISGFHERVVDTGYGFPSAHTTLATAMALTVWFLLPRRWRFLSVIWIILVAASRLYLGVHSPVDVVGAFGVGLAAVSFIRLLPDKIAKLLRLDY